MTRIEIEALTDGAIDTGIGGTIATPKFRRARWFAGHESGDVFGRDCGYDGPTLTVEIANAADAREMLEAISMGDTVIDHLGDLLAHQMAETERWRSVALDGLTQNTGLKRDLATARAEIQRLEDRYHRECLGLNNEGDPIGGDPPLGWKPRAETDEAELAAARAEIERQREYIAGRVYDC